MVMVDENEILTRLTADLKAAGIDPDKYLERKSPDERLRPLINEFYECTTCGATFRTRDDAIRHIAREHFLRKAIEHTMLKKSAQW